jgi:DNA-binding NtrC family response regulator
VPDVDHEQATPIMRDLAELIALQCSVLIFGENGTEKERIARAIQACGPR